jgi:hypothetical protein
MSLAPSAAIGALGGAGDQQGSGSGSDGGT